MNLLIFVTAFLMVVATLSYTALDLYQANALMRHVWDHAIQVDGVCSYNAIVQEEYRNFSSTGIKKTTENSVKNPPSDHSLDKGLSSLSFHYLIDPEYVKTRVDGTDLVLRLLNRWVHIFYSDQEFYKKIILNRPNAVEELFGAVRLAAEELPIKLRPKKVSNLGSLRLKDPVLQELWHQLLRDNPVDRKLEQILDSSGSPCIKVSLIQVLNNRVQDRLRVYLAPKSLLFALLNDVSALQEVLKKRSDLFAEMKSKTHPKSIEDAEKEFKAFCLQFSGVSAFEPILSFSVSKTNPKDYEE